MKTICVKEWQCSWPISQSYHVHIVFVFEEEASPNCTISVKLHFFIARLKIKGLWHVELKKFLLTSRITLKRMDTTPEFSPRTKKVPSSFHAQQLICPVALFLVTVFCSGDQRPKSEEVQLSSWCDFGLYCRLLMASLWLVRKLEKRES